MITILVIRHGIAEDPKRGQADSERGLTAEGWEKTRAAMQGLVRRGYAPTRAVSSPFRRAAETMACLKEATREGFPVGYWEGLEPDGRPGGAEDWLRGQLAEAPPGEVLALVSHQPLCSELVSRLTGRWVEVKKASCTVLHFDGRTFEFAAHFAPAELRS